MNEDKATAKCPLVSVIIITYNQDRYIRKAIESILAQKTNFDFQLIIGEDCSQDKTRDICIEYSKKYPNKIQLLLHDKNIGMLQNAIQSFRLAKGRYIAFCEADDFWTDDNKLQMQCDLLEKNPDFTGVHTKVDYVDDANAKIGESDLMPKGTNSVSFDYLVQKNVIHTCSFMFRRSILDETVYSILKDTPIPDYTLFLAAALKGNIYYLPTITAAYRKNAGVSATWTHSNLIKHRLSIYALLEKHYSLSQHRRALYATKQYQYFHLFSIPRKGRGNFSRYRYLSFLIWYTLLSSFLKPEIRAHEISIRDAIKLIFKSRFRLKNWRNYLTSEERIEKQKT